MLTIRKKNDQFIKLPHLRIASTGQYLNAADVRASLYDRANAQKWKKDATDETITAVEGMDDVSGDYDGAATGTYNIPIAESFDPPTGSGYLLVIFASQDGQDLELEIPTTIA